MKPFLWGLSVAALPPSLDTPTLDFEPLPHIAACCPPNTGSAEPKRADSCQPDRTASPRLQMSRRQQGHTINTRAIGGDSLIMSPLPLLLRLVVPARPQKESLRLLGAGMSLFKVVRSLGGAGSDLHGQTVSSVQKTLTS
eukprot:3006121-Amphidinium_carterae.1